MIYNDVIQKLLKDLLQILTIKLVFINFLNKTGQANHNFMHTLIHSGIAHTVTDH